MAEAATIPTTSPKQIGKQLRAVRRRKGLSLSEVARGAGLSRRELVAYERGKVEIPESDLWVLAGSCGVDVNELVPDREILALEAGPTSMGDTIEFLRRGQQNGTNGHHARALEAAPTPPVYSAPTLASVSVPEPTLDDEPAFEHAFDPEPEPEPEAPWTPSPSPARPVDVFEELARLPEPVPLNPDPDEYPDFLSRPAFDSDPSVDVAYNPVAPPPGTVELVDDEPLAVPESSELGTGVQLDDSIVEPSSVITQQPWTPADAPPIDVAERGETFEPDPATTGWAQPDWASATSGVWNEPEDVPVEAWSTDAPASAEELLAQSAESEQSDFWIHEPDPEATSTGFLVDWGGPDPAEPIGIAAAALSAGERTLESRRVDPQPVTLDVVEAREESAVEAQPWEPRGYEQRVFETPHDAQQFQPAAAGLAPISWHPELGGLTDLAPEALAALVAPEAPESPVAPEAPETPETPERAETREGPSAFWPEPSWPEEDWVVADDDWELGNALPLVEVRGQGSLVMRRADERWALSSLRVSDCYVMEVDLEFRSGPGFGVLFRADVDDEGRMSSYSFDVDPIHEGGAYLVRQWQADRELWNPIAQAPAADPNAMYGDLVVRLVVDSERLVAYVNNVEVMTVEGLNQASIDRGRDAPTGKRVGVQAWSSSDLVVETLRVADR